MKIERLTLTFGGKVPMTRFSNVDLNLTAEVALEEGDTLESATENLGKRMRKQVQDLARPMVEEKARVMQLYATLPAAMQAKLGELFPALTWLQAIADKPEEAVHAD